MGVGMSNFMNEKMDESMSLENIIIWGIGGQEVLIESMYSKAEQLDSHFVANNSENDLMTLVSLFETQTAIVKNKLQELDQLYIKPLEQIKREVGSHDTKKTTGRKKRIAS
jgi:hypothetical protein